ncbi:MAG: replicative DNA helicase [Prevotellaceae bacterium]|nr:replicative DNA helicase [Prevotellaceae bacterium]
MATTDDKQILVTKEYRELPEDRQCEAVVLGAVLGTAGGLGEVRDLLSEDCFTLPLHRHVWRAVMVCDRKGVACDVIMVKKELDAAEVSYDLPELLRISGNFTHDARLHAMRLSELAARRKLWDIALRLEYHAQHEAEDVGDVIQEATRKLSDLFKPLTSDVVTLDEELRRCYGLINANLAENAGFTGSPTGLPELDGRSGGLQASDLIVVAGETSSGKTSLAVGMMLSAARAGHPVVMYSMEMTGTQIAARLMARESGVSSGELMYSRLDDTRLRAVDEGVGRLAGLPVYFDDNSTSNLDRILASIRHMKARYGIHGAVVDYLQILNVNMKGVSKEQQMGDAARRLKNIAKELGIWVVALSQLNRDRQEPQPTLGRLRDSGQIADAADIVMLIYRPETRGASYRGRFANVDTHGTALIDVAKGRNVGTMQFIVGFDAPTASFHPLPELPRTAGRKAADDEEIPF